MATPEEKRALLLYPAGTDPQSSRGLPFTLPEGWKLLPAPPVEGEYTLTSVDGVPTWVESAG